MNVEDINVGDEVRMGSNWQTVKHIEGNLLVCRDEWNAVGTLWAYMVVQVRHPKTPLGYDPVWHDTTTHEADDVNFDNDVTHVVTHWSDGTCTLDTIAAFREAHQ